MGEGADFSGVSRVPKNPCPTWAW